MEVKERALNATKWAIITEVLAKLIVPITSMILARLLTPEAFGVIATVSMIISLAEIFSDAGFQKFLIQHEFKDENEKYHNTTVAFWTNFVISIFFWIVIALFCEPIATIVGNPGLSNAIMIACLQLPLTAFSSIQMALYKRDFDFKTLFLVRIVSVCIPIIITIPLALLGFNYWSLIIGMICGQVSNAIILFVKSKWKPTLFYDFKILKGMLSFSIWSLVEAISIWLTSWVDTFIIASALSEFYLGLYKTSTSIINALLALITSATVPVLFSALCRVQNNSDQFNYLFLKTQRYVSMIIFPLGIGVYLYRDLVTQILLGEQWKGASDIIGVWALTSSVVVVLGHYCSEAYRAKGKPKLSFLAQVLHMIVLIPVCIISVRYGFWPLVFARSWIRIQSVLVHLTIMKLAIGIPVTKMLNNVFYPAVAAAIMGVFGYLLQQLSEGLIWSFVSIGICAIFYFGLLWSSPSMRKEVQSAFSFLRGRQLR